ncbi:MAG TPA: hypothetical protein VK426_05685 [Methanobacterium sp.]|nr:hypothetical protein [Methanobacterium sp.]
MSRKSLVLIIFIFAVVGIYGLFYAAVTAVLIPQDLNEFKNELNTMPQLPLNNDSSIKDMESQAAIMESNSPLKYMSQSERTNTANQMRNGNAIPPEAMNSDFTDYNAYNNYKALAYSLILKGDVSNEIKNLSSSYEELSSYANKTEAINQKMATDFENGDNKAYADDLRSLASMMKQYNIEMAQLKIQLQNVINTLSK